MTLVRALTLLGLLYLVVPNSPLIAQNRSYQPFPQILGLGFLPLDLVSPESYQDFEIPTELQNSQIGLFCRSLGPRFSHYGWEADACGGLPWHARIKSHQGRPLIYLNFGQGEHTTLILGGVHPNELTPIPLAFRFARYLAQHPEVYAPEKNVRVIVAPLVNPDGFFSKNPLRTNIHGVDVNRNFLTADWYPRALSWWHGGEKPKGHFPGHFPNSEIETLFQIKLIEEFNPDKIISIHAPLGFLDYDGPGDRLLKHLNPKASLARSLVQEMAKKSKNYRVVDYSFYPGSLGNFAGNERKIPTVTLELETTDPKKVNAYWEKFLPGLIYAVHYPYLRQNDPQPSAPKISARYGTQGFKPSKNL